MGRKESTIVLVVGNYPQIKEILAEQKSLSGFWTITAANVQEALHVAETQPRIDMLLTDILLDNSYTNPEMNGVNFSCQFTKLYPKAKVMYIIP